MFVGATNPTRPKGQHALKALALGARAVLLGRPIFWGLAVNGSSGVHHVLDIMLNPERAPERSRTREAEYVSQHLNGTHQCVLE